MRALEVELIKLLFYPLDCNVITLVEAFTYNNIYFLVYKFLKISLSNIIYYLTSSLEVYEIIGVCKEV